MLSSLLNSLLYFPVRAIQGSPAEAGLNHRDLAFETQDGERVHGWWIEAQSAPLGCVLLCHGNAGNVGDRVPHAKLLTAAGFDVMMFDYRGYGRSSGTPSEQGTYRDAHAALAWLLDQPEPDASRLFYLGESLGGAVALELAIVHPPAGLILLSTFTSVRDMARVHYPFIPAALVPDAYPSLKLIPALRAPLLVLHGQSDEIVPPAQAEALFDAAPDPKRLRIMPGVGHNDLVSLAGATFAEHISSWVAECIGSARPIEPE